MEINFSGSQQAVPQGIQYQEFLDLTYPEQFREKKNYICVLTRHYMHMSTGESVSSNNIQLESVGILEEGLGSWWKELRIHGFLIGFTLAVLFASILFFFFRWALSGSISLNDVSVHFENMLLIASFCICVLIIYLFWLFLNRKRHFLIFELVSSSNESSSFSLFDFVSFFSLHNTAKHANSQDDSLLSDEHEFLSSSVTKEYQLNRFEINSWGQSFATALAAGSFIIAQRNDRDTDNTFVFYSRHSKIWDTLQECLEENNLVVKILHSGKISV